MRAFTEALRRELVDTRIRVITVDPGQVLTVRGASEACYEYAAERRYRNSLSSETGAMRHQLTKSTSESTPF